MEERFSLLKNPCPQLSVHLGSSACLEVLSNFIQRTLSSWNTTTICTRSDKYDKEKYLKVY